MAKILLVEDERDLANLIENWLSRERHLVEFAFDGCEALHLLRINQYDLVILDLMLPGMSGIEVCKRFRELRGTTPIIMLTAKGALTDKEQGFQVGADDYLTKPFHLEELALRVQALLRRSGERKSDLFTVGDVCVDVAQHRVTKKGKEIHLLPKEFRLLEFLIRNPNRVFSAAELLERVWESDSLAQDDTVRGHITRLRRKLDTPGKPSVVSTVYGVGYKLGNGYGE